MTDKRPTTRILSEAGQSPWLDNISRELLRTGKLKDLIEKKGLLGVTSNPTIFEKAISKSDGGYEKDIRSLVRKGAGTFEIYDDLTVKDIQDTCDLFMPVFKSSGGEHGFVSLEVAPLFAHDVQGTLKEAGRLFHKVNRPNVMIKVPATPEGVVAVRALIGMGININITLMFSGKHYRDVANAYVDGLEDLKRNGGDLSSVHSVASVFVSRIDSLIDKQLDALHADEKDEQEKKDLESLKGKTAISNSKLIYREFQEIIASPRFQSLKKQGANIQKVLWGSTSTKNPDYDDLLYVTTLIGEETVNTMPTATLNAFLDHGTVPRDSICEGVEEAEETVERLKGWGIDLLETGEKLQHDGLIAFSDSFDQLMERIELIREPKKAVGFAKMKSSKAVNPETLARLERENLLTRFFERDPSLWKEEVEHQKVILNRLGWVRVAQWMLGKLYELDELAKELKQEKFTDVVLLGMGGSSLAPEVMSLVCERSGKGLRFHILDTTDPESVLKLKKNLDLRHAFFIAASKSGSTVETMSQLKYFFDKVSQLYKKNPETAGRHFAAVTDDGSALEAIARERNFRQVFINPQDIGGRFSALSYFGLVPAALCGIDVRRIVKSAREFLAVTESEKELSKNPGIALGVLLAQLAQEGGDKLTLWTSKSVAPFGAWLEQLIAESTGKEGTGILPIDAEAPGSPDVYGSDRVFVVLKFKGDNVKPLDERIRAVKRAGFTVIEFEWSDGAMIGAEFLRWEIATAISSALLRINPFDEPNVKESKNNTASLLKRLEKDGRLPKVEGLLSVQDDLPVEMVLKDIAEGNFLALLVYGERSRDSQKVFARLQKKLRDELKVPVLVGFGPRYLHSIGQFYKGGLRNGRYFILLASGRKDAAIPGSHFSFGQLIRAQALGDFQALEGKDLPVLFIEAGKNLIAGTEKFDKKLSRYLQNGR